ncbi:UNVERIFIED_CONTAM: hypothetical protein Slati_3414300 [Sesamum latifolium]|uniref:Uncharacterized protein n=1 Tax=Sesamum latifolium TaxID=2727402 RepID=A0AAW2UEW0_9LAMI
MPFLSMGHGHSGTIPTGTWAEEISLGCHRLLHKMGGSRTPCPYHGRGSHEIHMEKYHISLRVTPRINIRQWPTIPRPKNTRLVRGIAHKIEIHLGISSPGQWESRGHQPNISARGITGESPFTLVYETEAIKPAELGMPSHRILHFDEEHNSQLLKENLDLVDELRETTFIQTQQYKSTMTNAHNKRVKARHFQVGDLVLQRVDTLKPVGKLDPKWEGPYKITKIIENGAYELEDTEGRALSRPWNIYNLRRFYSLDIDLTKAQNI